MACLLLRLPHRINIMILMWKVLTLIIACAFSYSFLPDVEIEIEYLTLFYPTFSAYLCFTFYVLSKSYYILNVIDEEQRYSILFLIVSIVSVGLVYEVVSMSHQLYQSLQEAEKLINDLHSTNAELLNELIKKS